VIEPHVDAPLLDPAAWLVPLVWIVGGWPYELLAFLIGSLPFGVFIARAFYGTDIRASGSGNIGAANALRTLGAKAGIAVLALDALKGALAVWAARYGWLHVPLYVATLARWSPPDLHPAALVPLAGLAAILGHCYSPWLRWRGGKGVATFLGATWALSWPAALAFGIVWLACVIPTRYSSLGSMFGTAAGALVLALTGRGYGDAAWIYGAATTILIVWKHRENIARLDAGTESRLTLRRTRA